MTDESKYITLIAGSLTGELNQSEEAELKAWLEADPANQELFDQYQKTWDLGADYDDGYEPDVQAGLKKLEAAMDAQGGKVIPLRSRRNFLLAAASLVFLFGSWLVYQFMLTDQLQTITTAENQTEYELPDGSKVYLNRNSSISFHEKFNERRIELSGEAFFEVTKDPDRPFTVSANGSQTQVLGTSFNVKAHDGSSSVEVAVVTGKVAVSSDLNTDKKSILKPGDKASVYLKDGTIKVVKNTNQNYLSWKNNELIFEDTQLDVIIADLENHFKTPIRLVNQDLAKCRFTGTFKQPTLEEITEVLSVSANLTITKKGNALEIDGTACH